MTHDEAKQNTEIKITGMKITCDCTFVNNTTIEVKPLKQNHAIIQ